MSFLFLFFFLTSYIKSPWSIDSTCLRERGLGKGSNRTPTYSYLLQGSKGFTFVMPLGTLSKQSVRIFTLIPLGMPTNRKPSSLRVNRELEIFWEPTVFNSAWLVSVLRTHEVSRSACLRPWPVASHIPLWLHQLYIRQFPANKNDVPRGGPYVSCWHGPHSGLFLFGSIPLKRRGAAVQEVSDAHTA